MRLHYVYPYPHVDEIVPLMAQGRILPYLDVPFQHAHPDVLRRMKRPASGEKNLDRLLRWRELCPEIVVRSTFIAGFPGETEAEFDYLLDFMREAQIDRAGCFAYSPVEGASANALPGALPAELREERRARFMAVAEQVSAAKLQRRIGATMQVLVDSAPALGRKGGVGRSYADAPEIDGSVRLLPPEKASKQLRVGEFTRARIVGAQGHDLVGIAGLSGAVRQRRHDSISRRFRPAPETACRSSQMPLTRSCGLAIGGDDPLREHQRARDAQHLGLALHPGAERRRRQVVELQADRRQEAHPDVGALAMDRDRQQHVGRSSPSCRRGRCPSGWCGAARRESRAARVALRGAGTAGRSRR